MRCVTVPQTYESSADENKYGARWWNLARCKGEVTRIWYWSDLLSRYRESGCRFKSYLLRWRQNETRTIRSSVLPNHHCSIPMGRKRANKVERRALVRPSTLEKCHSRKRDEGSNPSLSLVVGVVAAR